MHILENEQEEKEEKIIIKLMPRNVKKKKVFNNMMDSITKKSVVKNK